MLIHVCDATSTSLSITLPPDQQTLFEPCGWTLRHKLAGPGDWVCFGAFRKLFCLRNLSHASVDIRLIHVLPCRHTPATKGQHWVRKRLAARWSPTRQHVGSSPPCLSFEGYFPHCSWTQSMPRYLEATCFPQRVLLVRGMQRLDNAAHISTKTEHVVLSLSSSFLQGKCNCGSPRPDWALPKLRRPSQWQGGCLQAYNDYMSWRVNLAHPLGGVLPCYPLQLALVWGRLPPGLLCSAVEGRWACPAQATRS